MSLNTNAYIRGATLDVDPSYGLSACSTASHASSKQVAIRASMQAFPIGCLMESRFMGG